MNRMLTLTLVAVCGGWLMPSNAEAGPLMDWFRNCCNRNKCQQNTSFYTPTASNPMGLQPGQCARTCMQTCSRTVVNYVPQTCYRTAWDRIPVTQYKPVTNTDPCSGCTVTCMKPCTTYTWQMKRVPYTTYRPVYRTETYKVPVTTITNDCCPTDTCSTGTCPTGTCSTGSYSSGGCDTCGVAGSGFSTPSGSSLPSGTYYTNPADGSVIPNNSIGTVPADITPSLPANPQSTQRPSVVDQLQDSSTAWPYPTNSPGFGAPRATQSTVQPVNRTTAPPPSPPAYGRDQTASSPVRQRWSYSPVRLASHQEPIPAAAARTPIQPLEVQGQFSPAPSNVNQGWQTVSW